MRWEVCLSVQQGRCLTSSGKFLTVLESLVKFKDNETYITCVSCVCIWLCSVPVVKVVETTALVSSPLAAWSLIVYSVVSASPSSRIHVSSESRISSYTCAHAQKIKNTRLGEFINLKVACFSQCYNHISLSERVSF